MEVKWFERAKCFTPSLDGIKCEGEKNREEISENINIITDETRLEGGAEICADSGFWSLSPTPKPQHRPLVSR